MSMACRPYESDDVIDIHSDDGALVHRSAWLGMFSDRLSDALYHLPPLVGAQQ